MRKKRFTCLIVLCALLLNLFPSVFAADADGGTGAAVSPDRIDAQTMWSYLDDNTDPAGDPADPGYDRFSWTYPDFDDSQWDTAVGSFGAKNNKNANGAVNMLDGCYGSADPDNYTTYFFRTHVNIADAAAVTQLTGTVNYDDAVILYINGTRFFGGNADGIETNMQYSEHGGTEKDTLAISDANVLSALKTGDNVVAAELHNDKPTSSDLLFDLSLEFSTEPVQSVTEPLPDPTDGSQTDICLTMGADQSRMNFTWYSSSANNGILSVAPYADLISGEIPSDAQNIEAAASLSNRPGMYSNKATAEGLKPNTTYAYQLTNDGVKSEIYTFTTGGSGEFSFTLAGDPQIGAGSTADKGLSGWEHTLDLIRTDSRLSDVSFLLSAGDQVNTDDNETEYDEFLSPKELRNLPLATVIGNHDMDSNAYSQHFNIANQSTLGSTAAGGDSYFIYNNTLFMVLNAGNTDNNVHKQFMEETIVATKDQNIRWKVVAFHQSIYSVANHSLSDGILKKQQELSPILKELDIDVVLMGHDHSYCRTWIMGGEDGMTPITTSDKYEYANGTDQPPTAVNDPDGVLYITANSSSGSKTYAIQDAEFPYAAVKNQEKIPNISKVTVTENEFTVTTYRTTDMTIVDSFTVKKDGGDSDVDQTDINLSIGADPSRMNFTWYANVDGRGTLKIAEQSELTDGRMPTGAESITADAGEVNKPGYFNYKVTAENLKPGTTYAYQLINGDKESEIYTFTTGESGAFSFALAGDPQIGGGSSDDNGLSGWRKTLGIIADNGIFDGTAFLLSAGDQVDTDDSEEEYDKFLSPEELRSLPLATLIGNHDKDSDAYSQHFNITNQSTLGSTPAGGDNYFVYNNTLFMLLNAGNGDNNEHKEFMEEAIAATAGQDIKWKVVAFHQSIYSVAHHSQDEGILKKREELSPILKELGVDVVLMGHDHSYCRTWMMDGTTPIMESDKYVYGNGTDSAPTAVTDPDGILYVTVNSSSGSKMYALNTEVEFPFAAVKNQENIPNISKVTISDDQFSITTYRTSDMSVVDSFTITRSADSGTVGTGGGHGGGSGSGSGNNGGHTGTQQNPQDQENPNQQNPQDPQNPEIPGERPAPAEPSFTDVKPQDWYADAVSYVYRNGIMQGTGENAFEPDTAMSRGMLVTLLYRLEGTPSVGKVSDFGDVSSEKWYADAVSWASENGIVSGYDNRHFAPDDIMTREQMAAVLYRYAQYKGYDISAVSDLSGYADTDEISSYAVTAMKWAQAESLLNGTDSSHLSPKGSATRAQAAAIIMRFCKNIAK